ncbi:MAG: hypothetical protein Q7R92_00545, partial [bacterium]|nr:hypothetical protein [bacterium]
GDTNTTRFTIGTDYSDSSKFKFSASVALGTNDRLTITTDGNVGIGTTSPPSIFAIHGSAPIITIGDSQASGVQYRLRNGSVAAGTLDIYSQNAGASRFVLDSSGNIGMGTTTPNSLLSLYQSSSDVGLTFGDSLTTNFIMGTDYSASSTLKISAGSALGTNDLITITSAQTSFQTPASFEAAGDVSMAYDLVFDNPTASYIKSSAPFYIESGEQFNSSDLTLRTFNSGNIILDAGDLGGTIAQASSTSAALTVTQNGLLATGNGPIASFFASSTEVMRITSTAAGAPLVGIGTTSPYALLSLVDNTTALRDVFAISTSTSGLIFKVDSYGATYADAAYSSAGADYAEYFKTADADLAPGETVCVDLLENNSVKRCERGHDNNVMGIVSTKPSIIGNATAAKNDPTRYAIIGMLGQVDALVSAENGPINVGDSLTSASTTPGYAMKADGGDSTVAVALEAFPASKTLGVPGTPSVQTGKIKVLISRRNKSLAVEEVEALVVERIANMKIEDQVQAMIKQSVDNLNLDPKIARIAQEEANKLSSALTVNFDSLNNQIQSLNLVLASSFYITDSQGQDVFSRSRDIGALPNRDMTLTASNLSLNSAGRIVIGSSTPETLGVLGTPSVQIVDITNITASSSQAAFVVNQAGDGDVADFQKGGVSIMNIDSSGVVKVMGSMLVDGRIMLCTGGQCSNALDAAVDETMADLGVEGKVVAGAFEGYCDDGYVWAPGSAKYGTLPGFCVQSDLYAQTLGVPGTPSVPMVSVSQGQAQVACQNIGVGYHLIGENEWLTVAENILAANGTLGVPGTPSVLKLTNDNVINNLTGLIAEWTNQNVTAAGLPVTPSKDAWYEYGEVSDFKGLNIAPDYYLTDANNHIGKIYTGSGMGLRGFVRGSGGIYGLDLSHAPSEQSESIGFRCAK